MWISIHWVVQCNLGGFVRTAPPREEAECPAVPPAAPTEYAAATPPSASSLPGTPRLRISVATMAWWQQMWPPAQWHGVAESSVRGWCVCTQRCGRLRQAAPSATRGRYRNTPHRGVSRPLFSIARQSNWGFVLGCKSEERLADGRREARMAREVQVRGAGWAARTAGAQLHGACSMNTCVYWVRLGGLPGGLGPGPGGRVAAQRPVCRAGSLWDRAGVVAGRRGGNDWPVLVRAGPPVDCGATHGERTRAFECEALAKMMLGAHGGVGGVGGWGVRAGSGGVAGVVVAEGVRGFFVVPRGCLERPIKSQGVM